MKIKTDNRKLEVTRLKKGLTRNRLAKSASVGKITLMKLEEDETYSPNPSIANKICSALDMDFDELFIIEE